MFCGAVLGTSVLIPGIAFAADEIPEPNDASGLELLIPNPGEFIPMLVGFILLWVILAKFGWPKITGMLDKRVNTIKDSLEAAENNRIESERVLAQYQEQLADAKKQAAQIIADAKQSGDSLKAELTTKAHEEAEGIITKARAAVEAEKNAAIAELQSSVADLSVAVAGRLVGEDLSDAEHRRIIERYLAEAGSFHAN
jgi:F-type H+-transporting ATPase subunit b